MLVAPRFGLEDGEPLTLGEVGRRVGLSRQRVAQLKAQAIGRLRKVLVPRARKGRIRDTTAPGWRQGFRTPLGPEPLTLWNEWWSRGGSNSRPLECDAVDAEKDGDQRGVVIACNYLSTRELLRSCASLTGRTGHRKRVAG